MLTRNMTRTVVRGL